VFSEITTADFAQAVPGCDQGIRKAFTEISKLGATTEGLATLSRVFSTCTPLKSAADAAALADWMSGGITYMAMGDYPYPSTFLGPLPGYPINASCQRWADSIKKGKDNLAAVVDLIGVFYNFTGQAGKCYSLGSSVPDLGTDGWEYQTCTEMVMPMATNGISDMFNPAPWDEKGWVQFCQQKYNVTPRADWVIDYYGGEVLPNGGNNVVGSNILFSNGRLDPWRGGGVQTSPSKDLPVVIIEGGAHHLDLREPNQQDPASVTRARQLELKYVLKWIAEAHQRRG